MNERSDQQPRDFSLRLSPLHLEPVEGYMWHGFAEQIDKPCGVLRWCPYGPMTAQFPEELGQLECCSVERPEVCEVHNRFCPAYLVARPYVDAPHPDWVRLVNEQQARLENQPE